MTTADKPGPFDKAVDILQWAMNHETATHEQIESIKAVLAVLEAAGKVDGPNCLSAMRHSDANEAWSGMHEEWREINDLLSALPARKEETNRD